ncbi:MAG: selenide water [Planctomycetota bacterium]|nr:MAG: selenide water [Planctomycetota bacterium]
MNAGTFDDAGVYRLDAERALVQTVDFFTPIVDDPRSYGRIAIANALSDVYAMGGRPINALNILCYPMEALGHEVLHEILAGGNDKYTEAKCVLLGGHSVTDQELKFGAAVTGLVHPDRIWTNAGAKAGDVLVLSKRLGTGILTTALKAKKMSEADAKEVVAQMEQLNAGGVAAAEGKEVHAATDITGFALAGHGSGMAEASGVTLVIQTSKVPVLPEAEKFAAKGQKTRGDVSNREWLGPKYRTAAGVRKSLEDIMFDPQTSGGLFFSVRPDHADALARDLKKNGFEYAAIVGEVKAKSERLIEFVP